MSRFLNTWEDWELDIVKQFPDDLDLLCEKLPHRTRKAIQHKTYPYKKKKINKPKWTKEEINILKEFYPDLDKVSEITGRTKKSVSIKVGRLGISNPIDFWTEEEYQFVEDNWETMSDSEMAKILGRTENAVKTRRSNKYLGNLRRDEDNRLWTFNYDVFTDYLKSPDEAVLLGFIYADGSINKNASRLTIDLHEKDKDYLIKIKQFLNHTGNLKYGNNRPSVRLEVNGKDFVERLNYFGVYNNKSLTLTYPSPYILNKFEADFIRGYFEGDGSVYITKYNVPNVKFVGTEDMMVNIMDYFYKEHNISKKSIYKSGSIFAFSYGKQADVSEIGRILYKSYFEKKSKIFMERKLNIFKKIWIKYGK